MPNPSAPAYDPKEWNDQTTPEERDRFFKQHRDLLVRLKAGLETGQPLNDSNRYRYEFQVDRRNDFLPKEVVAGFLEKDKAFAGDDKKLAAMFGMKPEEIPALRRLMQETGARQGYEDYSNCYTYAMNDKDGLDSPHKSIGGDLPGERINESILEAKDKANSAKDYAGYKKAVLEGVLADGAEYAGADATEKKGYYRVAVYAKQSPEGSPSSVPNFDMHFVRENRDGGWSHKPGPEPVTDKDKDGKPITDPKTANLGGYDFLTYVYVPEGGLDVGRKGEQASKPGSPQVPQPQQQSSMGAIPDLHQMAAQMAQAPAQTTTAPAPAAKAPERPKLEAPSLA